MGAERLQKVLAALGVASRRNSEALIAAGRVTVNGELAIVGQSADPTVDKILVDGEPVHREEPKLYVALNKPAGVVTSLRSTHGERTVMEFVRGSARIFPVGRLDKESSGLLLFTNDGEWANIVTHPRYEVEKEYEVVVQGRPSSDVIAHMRSGVGLPDGTQTSPARVEVASGMQSNARLFVTVVEGKKRQIRLMAAAVGHLVLHLRRVRVGPIRLAGLPEASRRELRPDEVEGIRAYSFRAETRGEEALTADRNRRPGRRR